MGKPESLQSLIEEKQKREAKEYAAKLKEKEHKERYKSYKAEIKRLKQKRELRVAPLVRAKARLLQYAPPIKIKKRKQGKTFSRKSRIKLF